ncbi:MAG: hypothetical protein HY736_05790 [Verrucomicrobia bacterium]|nr:hypothetical protein [Verrucomicrobiota bacterium]
MSNRELARSCKLPPRSLPADRWIIGDDGKYQTNGFAKFEAPDAKPLVVPKGGASALSGDGWTGSLSGGHFKTSKGAEKFDLRHVTRPPPTLGAKPPAGAVVLFDGKNLDAFANKKGRNSTRRRAPPAGSARRPPVR